MQGLIPGPGFILKIFQYLSQSNIVDTCCIKASDDKKIDLISINEKMTLIRNKYFSLQFKILYSCI